MSAPSLTPTERESVKSAVNRVLSALAGKRFRISAERELQQAVARVLRESGMEVSEFVRLNSRDIPDMVTGRVGIELKVDGTYANVARQLHRYAQSDRIDSLVLVTTCAVHLPFDGTEMNGKCLRVFYLSMSAAF